MHACLGLRRSEGGKGIKKKRGKGPLKKKGPFFIFGEKKAAGGKATGTMLYTVPFFLSLPPPSCLAVKEEQNFAFFATSLFPFRGTDLVYVHHDISKKDKKVSLVPAASNVSFTSSSRQIDPENEVTPPPLLKANRFIPSRNSEN